MKGINDLSKLKIIRALMASGLEIKSNSKSRQKRCISLKRQWRPKSTQVMAAEQGPFQKEKLQNENGKREARVCSGPRQRQPP